MLTSTLPAAPPPPCPMTPLSLPVSHCPLIGTAVVVAVGRGEADGESEDEADPLSVVGAESGVVQPARTAARVSATTAAPAKRRAGLPLMSPSHRCRPRPPSHSP